jgi:hypothetical protein
MGSRYLLLLQEEEIAQIQEETGLQELFYCILLKVIVRFVKQVLYDPEIVFTLYIFLNKMKATMAMIQEIKETN